jgi:hypothetical protein
MRFNILLSQLSNIAILYARDRVKYACVTVVLVQTVRR